MRESHPGPEVAREPKKQPGHTLTELRLIRHGIGLCANALVTISIVTLLTAGLGSLGVAVGAAFGVGAMCQLFMLNRVLRATGTPASSPRPRSSRQRA